MAYTDHPLDSFDTQAAMTLAWGAVFALPALMLIVFDIIAAENEGRTCYAMEIDPAYCAVILERCSTAGMDCEPISS